MPDPEIIILGSDKNEEKENVLEITYEPNEKDEECFFLLYHLGVQLSDSSHLDDEYRKWLIGRTIFQKQQEQAAMEQQHIAQRIMPNLRV